MARVLSAHKCPLLHLNFADTHTHAVLCWARSPSSVVSLRQRHCRWDDSFSSLLRTKIHSESGDAIPFHIYCCNCSAVELFFAVNAHKRAEKNTKATAMNKKTDQNWNDVKKKTKEKMQIVGRAARRPLLPHAKYRSSFNQIFTLSFYRGIYVD